MPDFIPTSKGSAVLYNGRPAVIDRPVGIDKALIKFDDGSLETIKLTELGRLRDTGDTATNEIPMESYKESQISLAKKRLEVIQPIIDDLNNKGARVREAIERTGLSKSTIYRWLKKFTDSPRLTSLVSKASRKRKKRLDPRVEAIIKGAIDDHYLKTKKVSKARIYQEVRERCVSARLKPPHANTVYARIKELPQRAKTKGRSGAKAAREQHDANRGKFGEGTYPLQCVQMDTHELDVVIVDSINRQPIGTAYLTAAIDVCSRMLTGYHFSLDKASSYTAGACIHHMILPKDKTLERLGVQGSWPVWGIPANLHVDNGPDFRSKTVARAAQKHLFTVEFRPPGFPNWGGHIESFFHTLTHWVHDLDGTTKSNPQKVRGYDSIKGSAMTFEELETWFLTFVIYIYHERIHSEIGAPPKQRWQDGIEGRNGFLGIGTPNIPADTRDLRLDFLPGTERSVTKNGIRWSKIHYYSDVLDVWINEKRGGKPIRHFVRRDPHDISKIYFFDPTIEKYFEIPYSNIAHPSVDVWELENARRILVTQGIKKAEQDENKIFEGIRLMRGIESDSRAKTAAARRKSNRKSEKKRAHAATPVATAPDSASADLSACNVTSLPTKPKSKFVFSGKSNATTVKKAQKQDFGEWS